MKFRISHEYISYPQALAQMDIDVANIAGGADDIVWLLQHHAVYTAGTSAKDTDLYHRGDIPVYHVGRGGQYTYHGPGQIVGYVMLDLRRHQQDVRWFVSQLEHWLIRVLQNLNVNAIQREGRTGLWVPVRPDYDEKIAAIGVRLRRWVTFHGVCLNVNNDLSPYGNILPCGIKNHGITSLQKMGINTNVSQVMDIMQQSFYDTFMGEQ